MNDSTSSDNGEALGDVEKSWPFGLFRGQEDALAVAAAAVVGPIDVAEEKDGLEGIGSRSSSVEPPTWPTKDSGLRFCPQQPELHEKWGGGFFGQNASLCPAVVADIF